MVGVGAAVLTGVSACSRVAGSASLANNKNQHRALFSINQTQEKAKPMDPKKIRKTKHKKNSLLHSTKTAISSLDPSQAYSFDPSLEQKEIVCRCLLPILEEENESGEASEIRDASIERSEVLN